MQSFFFVLNEFYDPNVGPKQNSVIFPSAIIILRSNGSDNFGIKFSSKNKFRAITYG